MAIAVVGELVIGSGKFLETLRCDAREITGELSVLGEDHRASSHEAIDQRLLAHPQNPNPRFKFEMKDSIDKKNEEQKKQKLERGRKERKTVGSERGKLKKC